MKKLSVIAGAMLLLAFGAFGGAQAAFVDAEVPANAYITVNGLDWAWASPCSSDLCGFGFGLDLSFQAAFGWHVPSAGELALAPLSGLAFVFDGANVPYQSTDPVSGALVQFGDPGDDMAVAVPYFNTLYHHADFGDSPPALAWNGVGGEGDAIFAEFLVVREHSVPEPSTLLFLGSGLVGLVAFGRKRARKEPGTGPEGPIL